MSARDVLDDLSRLERAAKNEMVPLERVHHKDADARMINMFIIWLKWWMNGREGKPSYDEED